MSYGYLDEAKAILVRTGSARARARARFADASPQIATYAIVVGSNAGGPGQANLRYAEDDARRVGDVLAELGGYRRDQIDVVLHPTPDQLRDRLIKLGARVQADLAAGRQSRVLFYYSGHARAQAIDLGADELPLDELRARLFAIPSTLTVVVLDACQSGAFSRIKGAQPTADFSYNSRQHLDASGVAVLASSSGSELSQESEQLRGSYFTHHLLVGLRGAGDANGDGQVSIDEAYRYAYHQTLLATSETAVGGQHVTFEADLKGHGDVPLSFPRAATASIELPAALEGKTLVESRRAHAVVAETYKAKGAAVRIAVAPGDYDVLVRTNGRISRCPVVAGPATPEDRRRALPDRGDRGQRGQGRWLRPDAAVVAAPPALRGQRLGRRRARRRVHAEPASVRLPRRASHRERARDRSALRRITIALWVGGGVAAQTMPELDAQHGRLQHEHGVHWSTTTITAVARAEQPLARHPLHVAVYGQLGAGLGVGHTHARPTATRPSTTQTYFGPAFSVGGRASISATTWCPRSGSPLATSSITHRSSRI